LPFFVPHRGTFFAVQKEPKMSYFRPNIERMSGYVPGEQPRRGGFIKLNTNESPYPPSRKVLNALKSCANADLRLYPDPMATAVRRKAAEVFGTKPERVLVGNGSDDLLTMIFRAVVGPRRVVAFPVPTYSLYITLAGIEESRARMVPFPPDFSLPPALFRKGAAATIIANPNSPTGTVVGNKELSRLARAIDGVLVVDEAYVDFADENALPLVEKHRNVILLRTFSKSFSLCGVRLGFAVAREELIEGLAKVKDSYNVNRFAIAAGVAALDDIAAMRRNAVRIRRTRGRLTKALEAFGWLVYPSQSNFLFARVAAPRSAKQVYLALKRQKVLVRYFDAPGLSDGLRITIGSDKEITALVRALKEILP
jgi:histidinol-phosphate aminotransferase